MNIVFAGKLRPVDGANLITYLKIILSSKRGMLQNKFEKRCFRPMSSVMSFSSVSVGMERSSQSRSMLWPVLLKTVLLLLSG